MVTIEIKIPVWLDFICAWPVLLYRRFKFGYTYRRIHLDQGFWALVDPRDYYRLARFKWSVTGDGENLYAARILKETAAGRIQTIYMHREIMNAPKGLLVDHENGTGFDNRRANLRFATHAQNACNRAKRKNALSKYFGVTYDKKRHKWLTNLKHHGKTIYLGRYENEIDAARAYDAAAKKYHGEFARLNLTKA
jgi:hypothetical protein